VHAHVAERAPCIDLDDVRAAVGERKACGTKSGAVVCRCESGCPGSGAERARSSANSRPSANSASMAVSESWKTAPPGSWASGPSTVPPTPAPEPPASATAKACVP
jgi:hypothetical protein